MSTKFRLFAGVEAPLLTLPMLLQPVVAAPVGPLVVPAGEHAQSGDVIRVQAPPADDAQDPRKKRPQDQGQEKGQGREKARGQDRQSQDGQPEQGKPNRRDNQGGMEQEAPKPRRQQSDNNGADNRPARTDLRDNQNGIQRPPRNQQQSDQNGTGSETPRMPRGQQQSDQNGTGSETQRPQRAQSSDQGGTGSETQRPQRNQPKPDQAEKPAASDVQRSQKSPAGDAGAQPDAGNRAVRPPKGGDAQQDQQPARTNDTQRLDQGQAKSPVRPAPGTDANAPAARPSTSGNADAPVRPAQPRPDQDQPAQQRSSQDRQPGADSQSAAPLAPGQDAPLRGGQRPGAAPQDAQMNGGAGAPDANRPGRPPQTAKTPEQVERAREIAKDPKAAKPGEQAVLPVENGAAVLDSAKRPTRADGGDRNQPGQPGRPPRNQAPDQQAGPPPRSDADAQGPSISRQQEQQAVRAADQERGKRLDRRPKFERPNGWEVLGAAAVGAAVGYAVGQGQGQAAEPPADYRDRDGGRVIMRIDDQEVVRHDDSRRFYSGDRQPEYDQLDDGRVREVIIRDDGTRIVTIRNRYGDIIQRSRIVRGGQEYVLYYAPQLMNERRDSNYVWRDPGDDLPPMRLQVPLDDYIADASTDPDRDYYRFLEQPPVERVERVYSLDEVRYSARLRDKVRRIDLDTITFPTGSADISMNQAGTLRNVADGMKKVLDRDPSETFLIEGHTDAVGSDQSNLVLSDQRAESVARVLTDVYGIPPENMATQGYGEQYLKVQTDGANQENRRVTIRRITPLVRPVAAK